MPIVSIFNFISFSFYLIAAVFLYFSYQRTKNRFVGQFLLFFIILTLFFLIISLPGAIFNQPIIVGLIFLVSYILVYLAMASMASISLRLLDWIKTETAILLGILFLIILTSLMGSLYFKPAYAILKGNFLYWIPTANPLLRLIIGLTSGLIGLICIFFFLINGLRSKNRRILIRSLILGGGIFILVVASLVNYISGATPSANTLVISGLLAAFSSIIFLFGIHFKIKK